MLDPNHPEPGARPAPRTPPPAPRRSARRFVAPGGVALVLAGVAYALRATFTGDPVMPWSSVLPLSASSRAWIYWEQEGRVRALIPGKTQLVAGDRVRVEARSDGPAVAYWTARDQARRWLRDPGAVWATGTTVRADETTPLDGFLTIHPDAPPSDLLLVVCDVEGFTRPELDILLANLEASEATTPARCATRMVRL